MSALNPAIVCSDALCKAMSKDKVTLLCLVMHYGQVKRYLTSAKMLSVDSKGMYIQAMSHDSSHSVRIPFDPPLSKCGEAKPRMIAMKQEAEKALDLDRPVRINHLYTSSLQRALVIPAMTLIIYVSIAPSSTNSYLWSLGTWLQNWIGLTAITYWWTLMMLVHTLQSVYTARIMSKHYINSGLRMQYIMITFMFGVMGFQRLKKEIRKAQMKAVMQNYIGPRPSTVL